MILRDGKNKNKQSIRNTLDMYDSRDKLLMLFASLAQHYFHFKYYEPEQRKDRCKDKVLFQWSEMEYTYKVGKGCIRFQAKQAPYVITFQDSLLPRVPLR